MNSVIYIQADGLLKQSCVNKVHPRIYVAQVVAVPVAVAVVAAVVAVGTFLLDNVAFYS